MADKNLEELSNSLFPGMDKKDMDKNLKLLKSSFDMYEKTKSETILRNKAKFNEDGTRAVSDEEIEDLLKTIEKAQNDVIEKYVAFGGNKEDLYKKTTKRAKPKASDLKSVTKSTSNTVGVNKQTETKKDFLTEPKKVVETKQEPKKVDENRLVMDYVQKDVTYLPKSDGNNTFDVIPVPSNGECYPVKMSKVNVNYLTAYDENILNSPNAYKENLVIDLILNRKVFNNQIDIMDMVEGDRDAIILFLRSAGYGNDYPIIATDPTTGEKFEANIDLNQLTYKQFKLKGDENGFFSFTMPVSKDLVKFKFLTHRDNLRLEEIEVLEKKSKIKTSIGDIVEKLNEYIEIDETLNGQEKSKVLTSIRDIENWHDRIDDVEEETYSHKITNMMELSIMSVNGNTDREFIHEYVQKLGVRDARALRNYIYDNEPGINYNVEIEKPESLGGGSMKVKFQPDQYVFLNYIS